MQVPPPDELDEANAKAPEQLSESTMSASRKRKIDDLWAEMNAPTALPRGAQAAGSSTHPKKKKKGENRKAQRVLAGIFGKKQASRICRGAAAVKSASETSKSSGESGAAAATRVPKRIEVTETAKFAGQTIEYVC